MCRKVILLLCSILSWSGTSRAETFVLVHGAWSGGWAFQAVAHQLREHGHSVSRPTLTGLGERVHLRQAETGLATHIDDVVNHIQFENLTDVVLVGHSYGGMVITGVADRIPDRLARLVYVEGLVPNGGESLRDIHAPASRSFESLKQGNVLVHPAARTDGPFPRPVPQPVRTVTDPIRLTGADHDVPARYLLTVESGQAAENDAFYPQAQRARARGWDVITLPGDHNPQQNQPDVLAQWLLANPDSAAQTDINPAD